MYRYINATPSAAVKVSGMLTAVVYSESRIPVLDAQMLVDTDISLHSGQVPTAVTGGSTVTLAAADMLKGDVIISGSAAANAVTTDTAAAILAAINSPYVGQSIRMVVRNNNTSSGAVTFAAGSGVTLDSSVIVLAITKATEYELVITNIGTPAITIYELMTAGV